MIDIIRSQSSTCEFLGKIVFLIGYFGRDKDTNTLRTMFLDNLLKLLGCIPYSLVPSCPFEMAVDFDQREFQSDITVHKLVHIPSLDTQLPLIDWMALHGPSPGDLAIDNTVEQAATCTAVGTHRWYESVLHIVLS